MSVQLTSNKTSLIPSNFTEDNTKKQNKHKKLTTKRKHSCCSSIVIDNVDNHNATSTFPDNKFFESPLNKKKKTESLCLKESTIPFRFVVEKQTTNNDANENENDSNHNTISNAINTIHNDNIDNSDNNEQDLTFINENMSSNDHHINDDMKEIQHFKKINQKSEIIEICDECENKNDYNDSKHYQNISNDETVSKNANQYDVHIKKFHDMWETHDKKYSLQTDATKRRFSEIMFDTDDVHNNNSDDNENEQKNEILNEIDCHFNDEYKNDNNQNSSTLKTSYNTSQNTINQIRLFPFPFTSKSSTSPPISISTFHVPLNSISNQTNEQNPQQSNSSKSQILNNRNDNKSDNIQQDSDNPIDFCHINNVNSSSLEDDYFVKNDKENGNSNNINNDNSIDDNSPTVVSCGFCILFIIVLTYNIYHNVNSQNTGFLQLLYVSMNSLFKTTIYFIPGLIVFSLLVTTVSFLCEIKEK